MKRFLVFVMIFILAIPVFSGFADEGDVVLSGKCGANLKYRLIDTGTLNDDGESIYTLSITGSGKMKDYTGDGDLLTSSAPWGYGYDIGRIELPDGLTHIGNYAFCMTWDNGWVETTIPNTVTSIGKSAFYNAKLYEVEIPKSVKTIGDRAFYYEPYDNYGELSAVYVYADNVKYGRWVFQKSMEGEFPMIYGRAGSTTEKYCRKNDLPYFELWPVQVWQIELDKTEVTLEKGKSAKVKATVLPDNADNPNVKWTSADKSVAVVNQKGKITGVKGGTTVITAAAKDGSGVMATVLVTVEPVQVAKIQLSKKKASLKTGGKVKLVATATPANADDKTVVWTSSDTSIATVTAKGNVKAAAPGKCVITATSVNGVTATCKVTVTAVKVSSISIKGKKNMAIGATQQLTAIVLPSNAYDRNVTWSSSNEAVAMVDANGLVTAIAKGKATITCTSNDGSRVKGNITIKVK